MTQKTVSRERETSRILRGGGFPGGVQPAPVVENVGVSTPIIIAISNTDSFKLVETVEKIMQCAATLGISGPNANDSRYGFSPYDQVTSGKARVVYSTKAGWDESVDAALAKATGRAKAKAAALAKGAGVTLGTLVTVQEVSDSLANSDGGYSSGPILNRSADEPFLVDGELVRTIRVRVTYGVK